MLSEFKKTIGSGKRNGVRSEWHLNKELTIDLKGLFHLFRVAIF
jgi:hypothetical protein